MILILPGNIIFYMIIFYLNFYRIPIHNQYNAATILHENGLYQETAFSYGNGILSLKKSYKHISQNLFPMYSICKPSIIQIKLTTCSGSLYQHPLSLLHYLPLPLHYDIRMSFTGILTFHSFAINDICIGKHTQIRIS